jgi:hypothetical protein
VSVEEGGVARQDAGRVASDRKWVRKTGRKSGREPRRKMNAWTRDRTEHCILLLGKSRGIKGDQERSYRALHPPPWEIKGNQGRS